MEGSGLPQGIKKNVEEFVASLRKLYSDDLISVILYGSAASGELTESHSNINLLVVLKKTDLPSLDLSRPLVNKDHKIEPLFLSHEYIMTSVDVFPMEFLDMKENHVCLYGEDVLEGITVDTKNLRFQCEQELKSKLILVKQQYLRIHPKDKRALANLLFRNFTSVTHILRSLPRLKGKILSHAKEDVLKEISVAIQVEMASFSKIWQVKKGAARLGAGDLKGLLADFIQELDKIVKVVDKL